MTLYTIIDKAIRANFANGDGSFDTWKETLRKLMIHSFVTEQEDYHELFELHQAYMKKPRYRVKAGLIANYMKLHIG
jgi:hypothetical protein